MSKTLILLATLSLIPTPIILALNIPAKQEIIIAQASPKSIAQKITVKVKAGNSSASGTLISRNGDRYTLLTNAHVVSRGTSYRIITNDGQQHTAKLLKTGQSFKGDDLALLEFSSKNNYTVAEWADTNKLKQGDSVYSVGFVIGKKDLNITSGQITLITSQPMQGGYQIGFSSDTQQGMSGGALLNAEGKLIGILGLGSLSILNDAYQYKDGTEPPKATLEVMQRSSFAIPSNTATLFAQNNTQGVPTRGTPTNSTNLEKKTCRGTACPYPTTEQGEIKPPIDIAQQKKPPTQTIAKRTYTGIVKQIDDIAQAITVRIDSQKNGNGSGVIINKQGDTYYVLTAHHVIKNQDQYTVTTSPDGQVYKLTPSAIITISADNDLAVVKFQSPKNYQIAQIASYQVSDQWLFISGFPGSDSNKQRVISAGVVQREKEKEFNVKEQSSLQGGRGLVYTNLSLPGMSGGPVLDVEGRLIGINTGAENETILTDESVSEINFGYALGVPVTTFLGLASRSSIPTEQLKVINKPANYLQQKQAEEIKTQLFTFAEPNSNGTAKDWLNYGNELWRSFQYSKSVTAFERAIKLLTGKSTTAEKEMLTIAYFGKGLALNDDKKYSEAVSALNKASTVDSRFMEAWRWQGKVLNQLKQYPEALKAYQKAIQLNSKDFVLYVEQGDVLRELKRYSEAITSYNEAIKLKEEHSWAYNNRGIAYDSIKQYDKAIADYNQVIKLDPKDPLAYYNRGIVYKTLKQYDKAIADYSQALLFDTRYTDAYNNRGIVYLELKQYDKAIADYNQALLLDPKYTKAYYNRGLIYYNQQQYDKAIVEYNQALLLDPKYTDAYYNRGLVYYDTKQYSLAIADYSQAIQVDPKYTNAYYNRGLVYYYQKQYSLAIADYSQTIQVDPKYTKAYYNRGIIYRELKQYDKAIADYSQTIQVDPKYTNAYYNRGNIYLELKQYSLAIADYSQTIQVDPKYTDAYNNRGLAYNNLKQYSLAIADYSQAIQVDQTYPLAYDNRGLAYTNLKQYDKAIADTEKAAELYTLQGNTEKAKQMQQAVQELKKLR